ncbi:MAG: DsbA family protein, partial [Cyanobacteria bacterium P01_F01_bin.4]
MKATLSKPRLVSLTMVLCLSLLGCAQGVAPPEEADALSGASPEVSESAEADARAEWEARQQHIAAVMGKQSRAELIGGSPTKGAPDAEVVLFKFSDFQCPYCAVASADMKTFMDGREDVLYVYKHFPLNSIHPEATPAAKATWAAQQQGQFWLYHDGLFAYQDRLGEDYYVELAEIIGLDVEQFNRDRN